MNDRCDAVAVEECGQQAAQAANKLRQCVTHSENNSGRNLVTTDRVFQNGELLATRTTSSGAADGQKVELKTNGKNYLVDTSGTNDGQDPVVYQKLQGGKLQQVKDYGPEYLKVTDAMATIDFDGLPECTITDSARRINIDKEVQAIGDSFDFDKSNKAGADITETMDKGAKRLSSDLQTLSANLPEYNKLLKDLAAKVESVRSDYMPMAPELKLQGFNAKTGTFKNAFIWMNADSWEGHESYRIVQPGNTLSQIARDSYRLLSEELADGDMKPGVTYDEFYKGIMESNNITDPHNIKVGQVLKMSPIYY
jgi:hypothetical protein